MAGLNGRRILVVEDEPIVAMMVEDMLEELGAIVVGPVSTVEAALALLDDGAIDAALLDVNLGEERSHGVGDALRARAIPFVFATGYGDPGHDGFADVPLVQKPYRQDQIEAVLAAAIGR